MQVACPRCRRPLADVAKFCGHCGLSLAVVAGATPVAGQVLHPEPLAVADGYQPWRQAANLHFLRESAFGGSRLIGTEPIRLQLLNAGYPLRTVRYEVRGATRDGREALRREYELERFDRGETVPLEIASWEFDEPVEDLSVRLLSAAFDW